MALRDSPILSKGAGLGGGGLAERLRELSHLPREQALSRLSYDLKRPAFALPLYRYSLTAATPTALRITPSDAWPGNAQTGAAIVQGVFAFAGRRVVNPAPLWAPLGVEPGWLAELHGFGWLRDLRATGGDAARRCARDLVGAWLDQNSAWNALAWEPLTLGRRLAAWLGCYEFFAASAGIEFRHRLLGSIARQAQHLQRVLPAGLAGADLIAALKGLIYAGVCLPGGESWRHRGLALLQRELPRQLLGDGGHVERSPARHLAVLRDLVDLRGLLHKTAARTPNDADSAGEAVPVRLQAAVEAMAPALRMFQHGDGGLALFNGSTEDEGWRTEMVLQRAAGRPRPLSSAPESGFQRLRAGRTLVLIDAGAPPKPGFDGEAHAGTLGLEVSIGRERLIVNCGARHGDPVWRWVQRATAAHSTLVVEDINSSELLAGGGIGRAARVGRARREETDGNVWLDVSHDGYDRAFGLIHRRRLYLASDGTDLRGEDRLDPSGPHCRGGAFAVRFHIHPQARASLAQGGGAALLRLQRGGGWQLRAVGAQISLEQSIYLGIQGQIRRSQQVVLTGAAGSQGAVVKWALRRIEAKRG